MTNENIDQKVKTVIVFHHSDLDGIGVKILGKLYANKLGCLCETYKCNYNDVNEIVLKALSSRTFEDVYEIIIGDISVHEQVAQFLDSLYKSGVPIRLRDHHATAKELNKYEWAFVDEEFNGVPRCGTWLLYRELNNLLPDIGTFVELVDDWDTWKWVKNYNVYAKRLNILLQVTGDEVFTDYIIHLLSTTHIVVSIELFTTWADSIIDGHEIFVEKVAKLCNNNMKLVNLSLANREQKYLTGIIFCNNDISDVADIILKENPQIDTLMIISLPGHISYRTKKDLEIPLGELAEVTTGSGGGHPHSAGCTISKKQSDTILFNIIETLSSGNLIIDKAE